MAPTPQSVDGKAHVYCVETKAPTTACDTYLEVSNQPTREQLRAWWLRAAGRLRKAGTFTYKGGQWRFSDFSLEEPTPDGKHALVFGWRCAGDRSTSARALDALFQSRQPLKPNGIHTLAAAATRGCRFASYSVATR